MPKADKMEGGCKTTYFLQATSFTDDTIR